MEPIYLLHANVHPFEVPEDMISEICAAALNKPLLPMPPVSEDASKLMNQI